MIDYDKPFPESHLHASPEEKISAYEKRFIKHPMLVQLHDFLLSQLNRLPDDRFYVLSGATGAGKSTLANILKKKFWELREDRVKQDPEFIPCFKVNMADVSRDRFRWHPHLRKILRALETPGIEAQMSWKREFDADKARWSISSKKSATPESLTQSIITGLNRRDVELAILDEIQLLTEGTGMSFEQRMEKIKLIVKETSATLLLVGTYPAKKLIRRNAQLSRLGHSRTFDRYNNSDPEEEKTFQEMVKHLQNYLPLETKQELVENWDLLYEFSLGCAGLLYDCGQLILDAALHNSGRKLTRKELQKALMNLNDPYDLEEIFDTIEQHEQAKESKDVHRKRLRNRLDLSTDCPDLEDVDLKDQTARGIDSSLFMGSSPPSDSETENASGSNNLKPGIRASTRDSIHPEDSHPEEEN